MPLYCFTNPDTGHTVERFFDMGSAPAIIDEGYGAYPRDYAAERAGVPASAGWPMECVASGVHPSQARDLHDYLASRGVPTEVTPDGNPVYRDANHRRRALRARGIHDNASYD